MSRIDRHMYVCIYICNKIPYDRVKYITNVDIVFKEPWSCQISSSDINSREQAQALVSSLDRVNTKT